VERNEGSDAYYLDAIAPRGLKMQVCVNWYSLGFKEDTTAHFWTYNLATAFRLLLSTVDGTLS
jgi:hypothetical protein